MKESFVMRFDEKDIEVVETLKSLGVPRKVSNMIVYLASGIEATSREIERLRSAPAGGEHRPKNSAQEQLGGGEDEPERWHWSAHEGLPPQSAHWGYTSLLRAGKAQRGQPGFAIHTKAESTSGGGGVELRLGGSPSQNGNFNIFFLF
jgi:hypothetical protein